MTEEVTQVAPGIDDGIGRDESASKGSGRCCPGQGSKALGQPSELGLVRLCPERLDAHPGCERGRKAGVATSPLPTIGSLELLKAECLSSGIQVTDRAIDALGGASRITVHEYATTGGLGFELDRRVFLNAAFDDWYCKDSPAVFDLAVDGSFVVQHQGVEFAVRNVFRLPGYLGDVDAAGHRIDEVAMSHFDRVRVSPLVGCAYDCHFCDLPGRIVRRGLDRILPALEVASADKQLPVRHLLISGGTPGQRDLQWFEQVCVGVARRAVELGLEVDVMMSAQPDVRRLIDRLVDAGVSGFSINLELYGEESSARFIRQKQRRSLPYFEETVRYAVERLGRSGSVRSLIIAGLEDPGDTILGIEYLASLGCDPVISPFRPARGTRLTHHAPPDSEVLLEVLTAARAVVRDHGVALGPRCIPCQHNTLSFPWDLRAEDQTVPVTVVSS